MSLKFRISKLEDAPEAARSLYVEKDGGFELPIEGVVTKDKLDEFRNNNTTLKQQLSDLTKKFDGVDPELFKQLSDEHQKVKNKKLIDEGKIEEMLGERVAALRKETDKQIKERDEKLSKANTKLERLLIDNALQTEAAKAGVRASALEDVILRGRQRFKLVDDVAIPVASDGKTIYGKDGSSPQSMSEWLADLAPVAPHLFEPSTGGGTRQQSTKPGEKTMKRSAYEALDSDARAAVMKDKVVLVD